MSIALVRLGCILLFDTPIAVLLSTCIGVVVCLCPISSNAFLAGMSSLVLMYIAPNSASAAEDMTALII